MRTRMRLAALGFLLAPLAPMAAHAQTATPENTVITNTATASWTDANGNSYTPVTAQVSVTVGFQVGVDVTSATSVTPASPSTGNSISFTIANIGNGTDSVRIATTAAAGVTITGYRVNGVTYTAAGLDSALSQRAIPQAGSVIVEVLYTVAANLGGQTLPVSLTATSRRVGTGTDASTTNVIPTVARGVAVTPDGGTRDRLPSNGTSYTETFTVQNNGNTSDPFSLSAALVGSNVTIVSVNGTAGTSSSVTIAAGQQALVNVVYTVAAGATTGALDTLRLTATNTNDNSITDPGHVVVRVVRAQLAMTKEVFRDNGTTPIDTSMRVLPGEYIRYRITVTNSGLADAANVYVVDPLTATLAYDAPTADAAGWTFTASGAGVRADLAGGLAAGASRYFWVRARVR